MGHWLGGMPKYGVIFNLGAAKVCSPAIIETYFSYYKDIWIAVTDFYVLNCAISIGSYISINKFYSFIIYRHFLS